jgi:hypothetical protein
MKYDRDLTVHHPLSVRYPQHLENIDQIVLDEGGTQQIFNDEVALNLDKVKTNSGEREIARLKSMDMVVGLNNNPGTNPQTLLVDFKLRVNGIRSINTGDCKDKIIDSKLLLFGSGISVYSKYLFIFNDQLIQQFRSIIIRGLQNPFAEVLTIDEFKNEYF